MKASRSLMGRKQISRAALGFALLALGIGPSPTTVTATSYTSGPVYGGAFTWTTPALTVVPPTGSGYLGVAAFRGRFVAVERNAVASTSSNGATWVGHALPGPSGAARMALIAAGTNRVAIIGRGAAWTSVDGDTWTSASGPPLGPAQPTAMAALADGFVAVGVAPDGRRAAAWVSADGSSWTASPDQPAFDHFCPTAIASAPTGRVVAVGDDCYPHLARPAAAISDDGGLTWRRAPAQTQLSEEGRLTAVLAGGPGFLAVGTDIRDVYPRHQGTAMFVSPDGLSWRRVGYFTGSSTEGEHYAVPASLLTAIPGGFLAVAASGRKPAAFVSVDGLRWTRSASLPATPQATNEDYADMIHGIAVVGTAIVGVGTTDQVLFVDATVPGAFTVVGTLRLGSAVTGQIPVPPAVPTPVAPSVPAQPPFPGTVTWEVQALPVSAPPGAAVRSTVSDVTRWRSGFAAAGWVHWESVDGSLGGRSVVWTSPDGALWTERPLPSPCGGGQIAATRTAMVVVGADICRSTDGVAWTRVTDTPSQIRSASYVVDVIAGGPGFILVKRQPTSTTVSFRVWRSVDGLHWRSAGSPTAFGNIEPRAVAAGPRGIVILGEPYIRQPYVHTTVPLRSPDGIAWSRGLRQRAFEPLSLISGRASMIRGGPGYVAAGSYQPRSRTGAAVWTSPDGFTWKRVYSVLPASGFVELGGLARIGPGYAVVGLLAPPSQEDPALPTAWLSPDGSRWRSGVSLPLPTDGPVASLDITGAAGGSARLVAAGNLCVGSRWDGFSCRAEVWTATYRAP
jgi:hypothetical protein